MTVSSRLLISAAASALLVPIFVVAPASAATSSVSSLAQLQAALADCSTAPNTITLAADIIETSVQLVTGCTLTIDLGTFDLTVRNINIGAGTTFEVTGPTDGTGGTLTVNASGVSTIAGIRNESATFKVTGANVHATGGHHGAAIGGEVPAGTFIVEAGNVHAVSASIYGATIGGGYAKGDGGVLTISGGSVLAESSGFYAVAVGGGGSGASGSGGSGATLTVTGGTLTAIATGASSTAIGGGFGNTNGPDTGGPGGTLVVGEFGTVLASSPRSALGNGASPLSGAGDGPFGQVQVDGTLFLPSGGLRIDNDPTVDDEIIVGATGRILGAETNPTTGATIYGTGAIDNQGVIALMPPPEIVTGNNQLITFDTADPDIQIFAPSFDTGYRTFTAPPTGKVWNTASDGTGAWFDASSSTAGTGTIALYAVVPASLEPSADPADLTATAGQPYRFPVTVNGPSGTLLSPQPAITYTSPDCAIIGTDVFESAGSCTIEASTTVQGITATTTFTIDVIAGPAHTLALTPTASSVTQGGTLAFAVTGEDAYGNSADTSAAVLTSSVSTDEVLGHAVKFPHASPHVITATLGEASATTTIEVIPAPPSGKPESPALSKTGAGVQVGLWYSSVILVGLGAAGLLLAQRRGRSKVNER